MLSTPWATGRYVTSKSLYAGSNGIDFRHPNKPDLSLVYTIHYNAYKSVSRVFFATIYTHPDRREEEEEDIPCQAIGLGPVAMVIYCQRSHVCVKTKTSKK